MTLTTIANIATIIGTLIAIGEILRRYRKFSANNEKSRVETTLDDPTIEGVLKAYRFCIRGDSSISAFGSVFALPGILIGVAVGIDENSFLIGAIVIVFVGGGLALLGSALTTLIFRLWFKYRLKGWIKTKKQLSHLERVLPFLSHQHAIWNKL